MSITAETAKQHANDPAVLCCRAEAGITIEAANLEDPAIFDELESEEETKEEQAEAPAAVEAAASVQGAVATVKGGKVVISIKEGKDIYLELPV